MRKKGIKVLLFFKFKCRPGSFKVWDRGGCPLCWQSKAAVFLALKMHYRKKCCSTAATSTEVSASALQGTRLPKALLLAAACPRPGHCQHDLARCLVGSSCWVCALCPMSFLSTSGRRHLCLLLGKGFELMTDGHITAAAPFPGSVLLFILIRAG